MTDMKPPNGSSWVELPRMADPGTGRVERAGYAFVHPANVISVDDCIGGTYCYISRRDGAVGTFVDMTAHEVMALLWPVDTEPPA